MTIQDFFAKLAATGFIEELRDVSATYEYQIRGEGAFRVIVDRGRLAVEPGRGDADCSLASDAEDLLEVATGRRNTVTALMQGRLVYRGPIHHLLAQQHLFRLGARLAEQQAARAQEVSP